MKCHHCGAPATVHLTKIEDNETNKLHVCQECAEKHHYVQAQELNLPAILQTLLGQHVDPQIDELSRLKCPYCGIKYMELRSEGRLGCPHDYDVFRSGLQPLLKRIHRAVTHCGKAPKRDADALAAFAELAELQNKLSRAVESESYEEAARIRDLLREKEASHER